MNKNWQELIFIITQKFDGLLLCQNSNHNYVINSLSPNNKHLSSEHKDILCELRNIKEVLFTIKNENNNDPNFLIKTNKEIEELKTENDNLSKALMELQNEYNKLLNLYEQSVINKS